MGACLGGNELEHKKHFETMEMTIGNHTVIVQDKIAEGGFAEIWKCKSVDNGKLYALKEIHLNNKRSKQSFERQVRWLKKLQNIDGVISVAATALKQRKQQENKIGLILMEFCDISLLDQLRNHRFKPSEILVVLRQMATTLNELHQRKCLHLDIKLQNILLGRKQRENIYKICDFGSALRLPLREVHTLSEMQKGFIEDYFQINSSFNYRAPEMIDVGSQSLTDKIDIWMLGCVMYFLLYRRHPFGDSGVEKFHQLRYQFSSADMILSDYEKNCLNLVESCTKKMLQLNQSQRVSAQEIVNLVSEQEQTNF